ncbi:VirB8/TrbF family protein [Aquitalea palustris]|uniref:VirB8/TrbF family protein n=1 Tax=Aquitalea palustris TaxID=2480983 RepID=UPI001CF04CC7|nr:VirB8/TrbF family protein [Aquitalea palustris]
MGLFGKGKKGEGEQQAPSSPASSTPWGNAQHAWDDRMLRLALQVKNWQRAFTVMAGIAGLSVVGVTYIGAQSKIVPMIVEVDKLGRSIAVHAVDGDLATVDRSRIEYREVVDFIEDARTVIADNAAMKKTQGRMYARLPNDSAARAYIIAEFKQRDPFVLNQSMTIMPTVKTALKISDKTWQVEWEEQAYNLKGEPWGPLARYKANLETKMAPGSTEESLRINPIGFFVNTISWTKQI